LSNHHARLRGTANEIVTKRTTDEVSAFRSQGKFTSYAANAISSEELPRLGCHFEFAG
jgi:hypothetical protein